MVYVSTVRGKVGFPKILQQTVAAGVRDGEVDQEAVVQVGVVVVWVVVDVVGGMSVLVKGHPLLYNRLRINSLQSSLQSSLKSSPVFACCLVSQRGLAS